MFRRLPFALFAVLCLMCMQASAQGNASESETTRPNKQETLDLMGRIGRMPAQEQSSKIESVWQKSGSQTPRSDFMFCTGLAFLGNYKAQKCLGSAYENAAGIVEDLSEAYTWYALAAENAEGAAKETIAAEKERIKEKLLSAYPHPTEEDLEDQVRARKNQIAQYQADLKKK